MAEAIRTVEERDRVEAEKRFEQEARLDALRQLLQTGFGRAYLWRLIEDAEVFTNSFSENDRVSAFKQGKQAMGLQLIDDIQHADLNMWTRMQEESRGRYRRTDD